MLNYSCVHFAFVVSCLLNLSKNILMKNVIIKVVAVAAIMLSFAFSWVSSPAYALNKSDLAPFSINLDEYKNETAFTGVYNLSTKQWKVKPSVEGKFKINLKGKDGQDGKDVSSDAVNRKGGHSTVENELIIDEFIFQGTGSPYEIFRNHNVGFFFRKIDDKKLEIGWLSSKINERNFGNRCAPGEHRELIKSAIRTGTKYEIAKENPCV